MENACSRSSPKGLALEFISPATRLLEKRRQLYEVSEALESQKTDYAELEECLEKREEALRRKDLVLQESLIKFNKFLQENENKRNRAIKRVADERKIREQKEEEASKLMTHYRRRITQHVKLSKELEKFRIYQDYLVQVVETSSNGFPEIRDLLNRYRTLKDANEDLKKLKTQNDMDTEKLQEDYVGYLKASCNEVLDNKNKINELHQLLENQNRNSHLLQIDVDLRVRSMSNRALELNQVLSSVTNILDRCEKGSTISRVSTRASHLKGKTCALKDDVLFACNRLEELSTYLLDYESIVQEISENNPKSS